MKDIEKYLETLKQYSREKLTEYFDIDFLNFNDFTLINSFLIYQSITKNRNLLVHLPSKQIKTQFYIPVIFTLSLYEFINNYIDSDTVFKVGDILQLDKKRYKITSISQNMVELKSNDKNKTIMNYTIQKVKKNFIVTNANSLSANKVKTGFQPYKDFFIKTLNLDEKDGLPSKFKYKSIIVTDKKIVDELKNYEINGQKIHKAFPFRYITSGGKNVDNIPIEPMIYIVNNYGIAKKYIIDKGEKINNIIFIGSNKYQEDEINLSNDYNNGLFESIIMIGELDINKNAIPKLLKWHWTLPELSYLNYLDTGKIKINVVTDEILNEKIEALHKLINSVETNYNIRLTKIYSYINKIFSITIPNENSRLTRQLDHLLDVFYKVGEEIIEDEFFEIGEYDYEEIWEEIFEHFKTIINYKKSDSKKYECLQNMYNIDYLVVPKDYVNVWQTEIDIPNVISFKKFKELKKENEFKKFSNVVFIGFYGLEHLKEIVYNNFNIILILNDLEEQSYHHFYNKFMRYTLQKIKEKDRKLISEISFEETETEETVSELLERLFLKNSKKEYKEFDYQNSYDNLLNYELEFINGETFILEENKTVLLHTNNGDIPEKIKNIKSGDIIRIYENSSKDNLYKIALEADSEGRFKEIEEASKIWKTALKQLSKNFSSIPDFLKYLNSNGLSITNEITLRNWINTKSNVKFPQKVKDLKVIRKVCNDKKLDENFSKILAARSSYNGIMIALGRDLSDDVTLYIQTKKKGKILEKFSDEQIKEIINQNVPLNTVKSIKLYNDEN